MNRWLWIGSLAGLLVVSTGCLHNHTRNNCSSGACSSGTGLLGKLGGGSCNSCGSGCRTGCVPGNIGWQQGGLNYSSHLGPGTMGHRGNTTTSQNFTPGPPTGQVAYPYYTVRGPRDFLLNDPPTIGR
ncbi:hypothetical protein [Stieleria mannarensis]|uniref:hypothetical protein n=1 Tax=Stieleria mannarensis TaxID=2755585 RepID=UPI0016013388|nr:hypothetical protein [Rhodopirellula sp. JC639]